ncbi:hypothetical protein E9993_07950 [Labilibacter sediminis]|nr:hypothetical protein E9993_07950 [Labilibacter sediminis]
MAKSKNRRKKKAVQAKKFDFKKDISIKTRRLQTMLECINCDIFSKMTERDKLGSYMFMHGVNRIRKEPGAEVRQSLLGFFNKVFNAYLHQKYYQISDENDNQISINDGIIIQGLITYLEEGIEECNPTQKALLYLYVEELKKSFGDIRQSIMLILDKLNLMMQYLNVPSCTMFYFNAFKSPSGSARTQHTLAWDFTVNTISTPREVLSIQGRRRPIYRLGWPELGSGKLKFIDVEASYLGGIYKGKQEKLPVYMQSHAFERLLQRCDPTLENWCKQDFQQSFLVRFEMQVFNRKILFAHSNGSMKLGYFLADIIEEKIVIKTFLLITHANTPEGSRFQELTGFTKYDINYWNVDKLTTFINNDMDTDNPLYPYFEQAGLLHLFELKKEYYVFFDFQETEMDWKALSEYLNSIEELSEVMW